MKPKVLLMASLAAVFITLAVGSMDDSWAVTVSNYDDVNAIVAAAPLSLVTATYITLNNYLFTVTYNGTSGNWDVDYLPPGGGQTLLLGSYGLTDLAAISVAMTSTIGLFDAPGGIANYTSNATRVTAMVFNTIIMPTFNTVKSQVSAATQKAMGTPRVLGGVLRYGQTQFDVSHEDGEQWSVNLGLAWDMDDITVGFMVPYEDFQFDIFSATQTGIMLFGQYHLQPADDVRLSFTLNSNYMQADIDYDQAGSDTTGTMGGGISTSILWDGEIVATGLGLSYQYNKDDSNSDNDDQHLLKSGVNLGWRFKDNMVTSISAVYNWDVTNYSYTILDDQYVDVGAEFKADISDAWSLNLGYKQTLAYRNLDAWQIYLGSDWQF